MPHERPTIPRALLVLVSAIAFAACGDGGTSPAVAPGRVDLAALPDTAGVGDTLAPMVRVIDGQGRVIDSVPRLASSVPSVVAVLPDGRLHARATGRAVIRGETAGLRDSTWIIVERLPRRLRLVLPVDTLSVGDAVRATTVLILDGLGAPLDTARTPTFTSSDPTVLSTPQWDGTTGALAEGTAALVATAGGLTGRHVFTVRYPSPLVTPLPDGGAVTDVGVTWQHGCARTSLGNVYCWGRPTNGQLGNGLAQQTVPPTRVTSEVPLADLQVSLSAVCARGPAADVRCWGFEPLLVGPTGAQVGTVVRTPQRISLPDGAGPIADLTPAYYGDRCARAEAGSLFCWGFNTDAAIGPRTAVDSTGYRVRRLPGAPPFVRAAIAEHHGCGVTAGGALWCWGGPFAAYHPDPTATTSETPQPVPTPRPVIDVAAAYRSVCTIDDRGDIDCWGVNRWGAAGSATAGSVHLGRTRVAASGRFVQVRAGRAGVCALNDAGELWCWGALQHSGLVPRAPFLFSRVHSFTTFAMGSDGERGIVCAVTTTARVVCNHRWPGG
jgi:hypothetical protein